MPSGQGQHICGHTVYICCRNDLSSRRQTMPECSCDATWRELRTQRRVDMLGVTPVEGAAVRCHGVGNRRHQLRPVREPDGRREADRSLVHARQERRRLLLPASRRLRLARPRPAGRLLRQDVTRLRLWLGSGLP